MLKRSRRRRALACQPTTGRCCPMGRLSVWRCTWRTSASSRHWYRLGVSTTGGETSRSRSGLTSSPPAIPLLSLGAAAGHYPVDLTFGALVELVKHRWPHGSKKARSIVLARLSTALRRIEVANGGGIEDVAGLSLDDDAVIGRSKFVALFLLIVFGTANDGKCRTEVAVEAFQNFAKKRGLSPVPTAASMAQFLNQNCRHGDAYRQVRLPPDPRFPDGPTVVDRGGNLYYAVEFEPQERSRILIVFRKALPGATVYRLRAIPGGWKLFCERVEMAVLGRRGTDESCFDPLRLGYLPSGEAPSFCEVIGPPELVDAIAIAEQIIAEAPPPRQRDFTVSSMSAVPERLRGSLRGVRLASLLADFYPELVHSENNLVPTRAALLSVLRRARVQAGARRTTRSSVSTLIGPLIR